MRRLRQYHDAAHLVLASGRRWPKLLGQMKRHWLVFMTWATLRPAALAVGLLLVQMTCSRLIWPRAVITISDFGSIWWMAIPAVAAAGVMISVDLYFILRVGRFDRGETERYFDEAEHWLTSWKSPIIRTVTFGFVDPRKMVDIEVRKAMDDGSGLLRWALWWVSIQALCRITFGLILWLSWALFLPRSAEPLATDASHPILVEASTNHQA